MNIQKELERDGISGALYHLLWIKNEAFSLNTKLNIPDTIIYFDAKPIFWYYSTNEGLKKKKKENITNNKIFEYFKAIDQQIGVSAVYLYNENYGSEKKIICKYMDLHQLYDFLQDENKPAEGILQRFIMPFGINNCMIQVIWGQKICIFSKRINKKNIYDKRLDFYERCCTFDGCDHYSENVPVKGHLSKFLKIEIQKIVRHIASISFDKFLISRMLLYIKEDSKGKIWILWCNSMRIEGSNKTKKINQTVNSLSLNLMNMNNCPLDLKTNISQPKNVDTLFSTNALHPLDLQKNIHCLRCNGFQQDQNFIEISYKLLIKEHDHKIRKEEEFFNLMKTYALNPIEVRNANEEENEILKNLKRANLFYIKSDNDKIPVLLRRLHPKLTNKEYMEIRGLMEFQEHKILICQDCYMDLIQYLQYAGGQENLLEMIKQKAKSQKHKSNDLTIRRLENLKKPLYKANQVMHDKMKMICSYFRQKRCGQSFYNSSEDLPQINDKTNKKFNSKVNLNLTRESSLNFTINSKFLKRDSYKEQVDSLIEKYIEEPKEKVSVFKRLEDKIKPIVRARNKNYSVKYTSLHTFSNLKVSFDSATTNVTNSQLNKNEKELLYNY